MNDLISNSPYNIRRINFEIAQGILYALEDEENGLDEQMLSAKGLGIATKINPELQNRTTKGNEEFMELRRLGLIELVKIGRSSVYLLTLDGKEVLARFAKEAREKIFFEILYEKERLFRELIDLLQRRRKIYTDDMYEISGINSVKLSFLNSILKQLTFMVESGREGRKRYVAIIQSEPLSVAELQKQIFESYRSLKGSKLFVTIDELWKSISRSSSQVPEEVFDQTLINFTKDYPGQIELLQGISSPEEKILLDKRSETYFHYIKIPEKILEIELTNG